MSDTKSLDCKDATKSTQVQLRLGDWKWLKSGCLIQSNSSSAFAKNLLPFPVLAVRALFYPSLDMSMIMLVGLYSLCKLRYTTSSAYLMM
ncbi:hypothetical protein WISP_15086 [Willisornis vidua]|uniref:Uncharacterized protein n=1 Tax=Willisornis vidua TaxID=1566151 RepID=A0ABQ9DQ19_9PASS|nr:hypothetical protein WISP_15086 [Willisornis vidua]